MWTRLKTWLWLEGGFEARWVCWAVIQLHVETLSQRAEDWLFFLPPSLFQKFQLLQHQHLHHRQHHHLHQHLHYQYNQRLHRHFHQHLHHRRHHHFHQRLHHQPPSSLSAGWSCSACSTLCWSSRVCCSAVDSLCWWSSQTSHRPPTAHMLTDCFLSPFLSIRSHQFSSFITLISTHKCLFLHSFHTLIRTTEIHRYTYIWTVTECKFSAFLLFSSSSFFPLST